MCFVTKKTVFDVIRSFVFFEPKENTDTVFF